MSSDQSTLVSQPSTKSQRVLACVLCQQRKVKCDRKFPCANCIKAQAQCVPASQLPRKRRRRFPERALLDQLRSYEDLLRKNNIKFDPLHKPSVVTKASPSDDRGDESDEEQPEGADGSSPVPAIKSEVGSEFRNFWHAMRLGFLDGDDDSDSSTEDVGVSTIRKAWDQMSMSDDYLIFGSRQSTIDLATLHPEPAQIFRLWQLYMDNVNPLLRVIHVPTMQGRVIEAVSNLKGITAVFEALLFSIYSMAILSLDPDECPTMFGSPKQGLLTRFQFGCQQALLNCGFLRCSERDCLTALFLYIASVSTTADPRALCSLTGLAIRLAQRMKIENESANAKCGVLEGEMRRRLWWALVIFDVRVSQLADFETQTLTPTWDCRIPLNVNDADLRAEMKEPPAVHGQPTEAIFAVVRAETADFTRNSHFHLHFAAPYLIPIARDVQSGPIKAGSEFIELERIMEDKYLKFCDPENPLQFMTVWNTRAYLAKCRLMETYSKPSTPFPPQGGNQLIAAIPYALRMLECDTKVMTSPLTKGFRWTAHHYFPFPAYIHLGKALREQPISEHTDRAWEIMSDNYEVRFCLTFPERGPFFDMFTKLIFHAWEPREAALMQSGETVVPPRIITRLRDVLQQKAEVPQGIDSEAPNDGITAEMSNFPSVMPMQFGGQSVLSRMDFGNGYAPTPGTFNSMPAAASLDIDMDQLDWSAMDWGNGARPSW